MIRRADIENAFQIDEGGFICSPGMFQGEPLWVPYFWNLCMEVLGEGEGGEKEFLAVVDDDDRREFPELIGIKRIQLVETKDGKVTSIPIVAVANDVV